MRNKSLYPENWVDEIRPTILMRDKFKCTICGVQHRQYVLLDDAGNYTLIEKDEYVEYLKYGAKTYRIYLNVCHKDHNKNNCHSDNLFSACPKCHHKHDIQHKRLIRLSNKKDKEQWIDKIDPNTLMMF